MKEDKRKIVIPFTLDQFKDAIERIKAEFEDDNLYFVGLFEIETLEYYYERAKEYEDKETAMAVNNFDKKYCMYNCPNCSKVNATFKSSYCPHCGQKLDWSAIVLIVDKN